METKKVSKATYTIDHMDNCPVCGTKLNAFTNTVNEEGPENGDLTVCYKCTSYLVINPDLTVRPLSVEELTELPSEALTMLTKTRTALRKLNEARMNSFKPHFPNFVDACDEQRKPVSFLDTSDLLKLDHVKQFATHPDFSGFVMGDELLLALLDDGERWMVVGAIKDPSTIKLPRWTGPKK